MTDLLLVRVVADEDALLESLHELGVGWMLDPIGGVPQPLLEVEDVQEDLHLPRGHGLLHHRATRAAVVQRDVLHRHEMQLLVALVDGLEHGLDLVIGLAMEEPLTNHLRYDMGGTPLHRHSST